jgi:putative nucleotidyltransferase with HDIG domain
MVRMSDIFKKIEGNKKAESMEPAKASPIPPVPDQAVHPVAPQEHHTDKDQKAAEEKNASAQVCKDLADEFDGPELAECEKVYDEARALLKELLKEDVIYELVDTLRIPSLVDRLIDLTCNSARRMTEIALNADGCQETAYVYCHSVNVTILSLLLGQELGYNREQLRDLGTAALLHDIGMVHYLDIISLTRKLTKDEFEKMKNHTIFGVKVLGNIRGMKEIVFTVARQHHEHLDGSGYPEGLRSESIHEYSKILCIVDIYEAMMHRRAWRMEFQAVETMQEILKHKTAYDPRIVKVLIGKIGIFPVGSLVELNTREMARVIKLNLDNVLRPVVRIIRESNGDEARETKIIDLAAEHAIWIKHADKE